MDDSISNDKVGDYFINGLIVKEYYALALVAYLEAKGLLDRDEFNVILKEFCEKSIRNLKDA